MVKLRLRDFIAEQAAAALPMLLEAAKNSTVSVPADKLLDPQLCRLRSLAMQVATAYGLQTTYLDYHTHRVLQSSTTSCEVAVLLESRFDDKKPAFTCMHVLCSRTADRKYVVTSRVLPVSEWPTDFQRYAGLTLLANKRPFFVFEDGSIFERCPTKNDVLYPGSYSRTYCWTTDDPNLTSTLLDRKRVEAVACVFAAYNTRVTVDQAWVATSRGLHVWWVWSPKNWQGTGETPRYLSVVQLLTVMPKDQNDVTKIRLYCFDECDGLKALTCPQEFLDITAVRSYMWRHKQRRVLDIPPAFVPDNFPDMTGQINI